MKIEKPARPPIPPFTATDITKPKRIATLRTYRDWPIPWFVPIRDGAPDFVILDSGKAVEALYKEVCWICGQRIISPYTFTVGPMCGVNLISADPPQHYECARYAATVCPFLIDPKHRRRDRYHRDANAVQHPAALSRNPGVTLLWQCKSFATLDGGGSPLCRMGGPPIQADWLRQGRDASRDEVIDAIDAGVPKLRSMIDENVPEDQRASEHRQLDTCVGRLQPYLPVA